MKEISFDQLPEAVNKLNEKLENIEQILLNKSTKEQEREDEILSVEQAAEFLGLSKPTLYSKNSRGELPYFKRGKRVYYSKNDLIDYLIAGRQHSLDQLNRFADDYINEKGGSHA